LNPVIHTQHLTRQFGETVAVDSLDLSIARGEVFGFLGHNGAGKTTTVRLLNGILAPSGGSAQILGLDSAIQGAQIRAQTGVLTETPAIDERLTGYENLHIFGRLFNVEDPANRTNSLLDQFDLLDRAHERVSSYSKGMKQRLALARAFLHDPQIIFLDEPTSSLDPVATHQVHEMIRTISQDEGRTVFICTHNLDEAARLCHRVGVMDHGKLIALGTPAELTHQADVALHYELEVQAEDAHIIIQTVQNLAGATQVEHRNNILDVWVDHRETVPDMLGALYEAGVRVYRVTPQELTLEDVYLSLHNQIKA
jgi:ABC-2 type transport system ATP-binding protein